MLNSCNFLGTWRWVKSAFVLLANSLDESTIVCANTNSEVDLVVTISLKTLEAGLNLFDLSIDSQVVTKDQMDGVGGNAAAFSHEHFRALLVELDV